MDRAAQRHAGPPTTSRTGSHRRCTLAAKRILQDREAGMALLSQAELFRSSLYGAAGELELNRSNIPSVGFYGLNFLEAVT